MFVHLFESINLLSKFFQRYRLCVHFAFFSPDPDTDAEVFKSDNNANDGYDSQVPCLFVHLVMVVNDDGYNSQVACSSCRPAPPRSSPPCHPPSPGRSSW